MELLYFHLGKVKPPGSQCDVRLLSGFRDDLHRVAVVRTPDTGGKHGLG